MNYFFIYRLSDGVLNGSPYFGEAEEWTNIPDGCAVIGPISHNDSTAVDAFVNSDCYTVVSGQLAAVPDIDAIKAARAAASNAKTPQQKEMDKLKTDNVQLTAQVIDLWETLISSGVL